MMTKSFLLILYLLGSLAIGRSLPIELENGNSELLDFGVGPQAGANLFAGTNYGAGNSHITGNFVVASFSDILYNQLITSKNFQVLFSNSINANIITNICLAISQSLANEMGLKDSSLTANFLTNALVSLNRGSSHQAYGRILADVLGQVMFGNNIINSENYASFASTVAQIILNSITVFLGDAGFNGGLGANLGTAINLGARKGNNFDVGETVGVGLGFNSGLGIGTNVGIGSTLNDGLGIRLNSGVNLGAGLNADTGLGAGLGVGLNYGVDLGAGLNAGTGLGIGWNSGVDLRDGFNVGAGLGVGLNSVADLGAGLNAGAGLGVGLNSVAGLGIGLNSGVDLGAGFNVGSGLGVGLNANADLETGLNADLIALNSGISGSDIDLSVSKEALALFNTELKLRLQNDRYFRYVFCDYVPYSSLKLVIDSMIQYISKAFSIAPSYLLPLENVRITLSSDIKPSVELYSQIIASSLTNIFSSLNIITTATAKLQASMTKKAIASAIANFLKTSSHPGIGIGTNGNLYSSPFSVINGLRKLPYVGTDAISKFPPIVQTALVSKSAREFSEILFYKLISSNEVSQAFLLGIPAYTLKIISNILGINMAEAFGSPDPGFFSNIFSTALLITGRKLNYRTYARALSFATAKALSLLGYFLSGDVNIQAAIASNAIIRTLTLGLKSASVQVTLFPEILRLPWTTRLTGVPPADFLLTIGKGVGLGAGIGANVGLGVDAGVNANLGISTDDIVRADTLLDTKLDAGVETDVVVGFEAGLNQGDTNLKRRKRDTFDISQLDFASNAETEAIANTNLGIGTNLGLGVDAGVNANLGIDTNLGLGIDAGINADLGVNVEVGPGAENVLLSILNVLPKILANKFYQSIALSTSTGIVGTSKIIDLIAQSIAVEFGFPIAAVFLNSYTKIYASYSDTTLRGNAIALACSTTEALAKAGFLNSKFTVLTANQLATATVAKISSLITTSLEDSDWNTRPRWTFWQPPLTPVHYLLK